MGGPSGSWSGTTGGGEAIVAAVLRSWSGGGATAWGELDAEWSLYGDTPIAIDNSLGGAPWFTLEDLVALDADVLILSNPAGGNVQWTDDEIEAVYRYAELGHNVIGTYRTFQWGTSETVYDNTALAPLFGLPQYPFDLGTNQISNQFTVLESSPLFEGLGDAWASVGFPRSHVYDRNDDWSLMLEGPGDAQMIAQSDDFRGAITLRETEAFAAIYISNMPEYFGGPADKQLLYNAITY